MEKTGKAFYAIDLSIRAIMNVLIIIWVAASYSIIVLSNFRIFQFSNMFAMIFLNIAIVVLLYYIYQSKKNSAYKKSFKITLLVTMLVLLAIPMIFSFPGYDFASLYLIIIGCSIYDLMFYNYQGPYLANLRIRSRYYFFSTIVYILFLLLPMFGMHLMILYRRFTRDVFIHKRIIHKKKEL